MGSVYAGAHPHQGEVASVHVVSRDRVDLEKCYRVTGGLCRKDRLLAGAGQRLSECWARDGGL